LAQSVAGGFAVRVARDCQIIEDRGRRRRELQTSRPGAAPGAAGQPGRANPGSVTVGYTARQLMLEPKSAVELVDRAGVL
jgi:hypothetical protein